LICPNCKSEKWESVLCPKCGLNKEDALLSAAELYRKEGKIRLAIENFDKYLQLNPDSFTVRCENVNCLCLEAIAQQELSLFNKANDELRNLLLTKWDWEQGHQYRLDLFYHFGRLKDLLTDYEQIGRKDENRKGVCEKVINIIHLTNKFQNNPPNVTTNLESDFDRVLLLKSFWPLAFGLPVLLWAAYSVSTFPHAKDEGNIVFLFFIFVIFGLIIVMLFFVSMKLYRAKKRENGVKKIEK
jgi:tetratricopeptide (TPR) repeat protein